MVSVFELVLVSATILTGASLSASVDGHFAALGSPEQCLNPHQLVVKLMVAAGDVGVGMALRVDVAFACGGKRRRDGVGSIGRPNITRPRMIAKTLIN